MPNSRKAFPNLEKVRLKKKSKKQPKPSSRQIKIVLMRSRNLMSLFVKISKKHAHIVKSARNLICLMN